MKLGFRTTLILVLSLLLLGSFGLFQVYQMASLKEKEILELREKLLVINEKKNNITAFKKFLEEIKEDKNRINGVFLIEDKIIKFIENLEKISKLAQTEIEIQSALLSEKEDLGPVFNFKLTGSFENLFRSLSLMENLPHQIEIKELRLVKEREENLWQAQFRIQVLSFI